MWQFMPFRGAYGLERNGFFDERFDPEQSTLAYARYMKSLYNQFGDWYLAMAAYNWGPGRVQHAVAKTGYADFWELYRLNALPAATKAYVPSIIAAAIMAKNPKQYGLTDVVPDAAILSDEVTTNYAIDMRLVADLTNATLPRSSRSTPHSSASPRPTTFPTVLHLPPGTRDMFLARLKNIPEEDRTSWRFHVVQNGETLDQIAESMHAHASEITSFNDLTDPIEAGDELVIPIAASSRLTPGQRYTMRRKGHPGHRSRQVRRNRRAAACMESPVLQPRRTGPLALCSRAHSTRSRSARTPSSRRPHCLSYLRRHLS